MGISEELTHAVTPHEIFSFHLFGAEIMVTDTVIVMWIIMAVIIIAAFALTRDFKPVPSGKQNVAEALVDFVGKLAHDNIGHHGAYFAPYLGTVLLFLILSNIAAIFAFIPGELLAHWTGIESLAHFNIRPPTRDVNVTAALAVMSILLVLFAGFRFKGFKGWLHYLIEPVPVILPFKLLDYVVRPTSLCFRLFGNIVGAFIVMEILYIAVPFFIPAAFSIYFDLFDGFLQAYVFVFLTSLYIAEAIE